jgi:hypothetical protein
MFTNSDKKQCADAPCACVNLLPRSFIPRIKLPPLLNKKERFEDVKAPTCFFPTSVVPSIQPDSPFQFDEYDSQGTSRALFVKTTRLCKLFVKKLNKNLSDYNNTL